MAVADIELFQKYKLLTAAQKQSVDDFIAFLLSKEATATSQKPSPATLNALLQVSVWDEEAEQAVLNAQEAINQWQPLRF